MIDPELGGVETGASDLPNGGEQRQLGSTEGVGGGDGDPELGGESGLKKKSDDDEAGYAESERPTATSSSSKFCNMEVLKFLGILLLFLILNFGSLAIAGQLQRGGPGSEWYKELKTAPWSPPGWVFAAAWSTIGVTYSIYMTLLVYRASWIWYVPLFLAQLILNPSWSAVFFGKQMFSGGLAIIVIDLVVVWATGILFAKSMKWWTLLIVPYAIWLCIATSLNAYVVAKN